MKRGICKLCFQEKELCRESHIFPKFHYKFLYGANNQLIYLNSKKSQTRYNSEYESNILCKECDENILGKLDDYAANLIHDNFATKTEFSLKIIDGREHIILKDSPNYKYSSFKLFLLSLLWRASISSRPFFQTTKLNFQTEEDLRLMILKNDPKEPEKYACFINLPPLVSTPDGGRGFNTLYMPTISPEHIKKDGLEICQLIIEGIRYSFIISVPKTWNIAPGVGRNKLTIGFTTLQDQTELLQKSIEMIKIKRSRPTPIKSRSGK